MKNIGQCRRAPDQPSGGGRLTIQPGQIQDMAVGNLVLTRNVNGTFVLNYDIEQSSDLVTWTKFQANSLPLTSLPTNKAFVRIRAK